MEPLLRGHSERSTPMAMERPLINGNVKMKVYIPTLRRCHPSWKSTFLVQKGWPHKWVSIVYKYICF